MSQSNPFGSSTVARLLDEQITLAAQSDAKVLITGESGAGKELAAHLIHKRSARRNAPFLPINCAAIADSLLESQLFGHVRGSFTDAYRDSPGLIELAHGGALMLDEIGEMSPRMQALLLRFLETGEVQRVGDTRPVLRRDVRVIAATNVDLWRRVQEGTFRADLYYRLNVLCLHVPPLRERRDDVPVLMERMLAAECERQRCPLRRLTPAAAAAVMEYAWPGNVRELRNVAERLALHRVGRPIERDDLPPELLMPSITPEEIVTDASALRRLTADALFERMVGGRESFWTVVYDRFMSHDVTREEVVLVVRRGLERTRSSFPALMPLFNMEAEDLKPFLTFLRKHQCLMALQAKPNRLGAVVTDAQARRHPATDAVGVA